MLPLVLSLLVVGSPDPGRVVFFGSSETSLAKFPSYLEYSLPLDRARIGDLRHVAFGGYSTTQGAPWTAEILAKEKPQTLAVCFGGADGKSSALVAKYTLGLDQIAAATSTAIKLVIISPSAIECSTYTGTWGTCAEYDARIHQVRDLGAAWVAAHTAHATQFIDVYTPTRAQIDASPTPLMLDGLHENWLGARNRAEIIARELLGEPSLVIAKPACITAGTATPTCDTRFFLAYKRAIYYANRVGLFYTDLANFTAAENAAVEPAREAYRVAFNAVMDGWRVQLGWQGAP